MAYPTLRSMNASMHKGAVEGKYKQLYPDREVVGPDWDAQSSYHQKDELSLPMYGYGMKQHQDVPAGPNHATIPGYYDNRLEREGHNGPVLGRTW